jgi:hypothetical protein
MKNYNYKRNRMLKALFRTLCFAIVAIACAATLAMAVGASGYIDGVISHEKVNALAEHLNITPVEAYVAQELPNNFILQTLITMHGRRGGLTNAPEKRWYTIIKQLLVVVSKNLYIDLL